MEEDGIEENKVQIYRELTRACKLTLFKSTTFVMADFMGFIMLVDFNN